MPALAITDHNNVSAAVQFYKTATAAGIKPIQGAELTLEKGHHLVCLAENPHGIC
jgi:error-prone DNA polymerase